MNQTRSTKVKKKEDGVEFLNLIQQFHPNSKEKKDLAAFLRGCDFDGNLGN